MIKKFIHDYFTFTRSERFAFIFLSLSVVVITLLPRFFGRKAEKVDPRDLVSENVPKPDAESAFSKQPFEHKDRYRPYRSEGGDGTPIHVRMFRFDPNLISGKEWQLLGVPEKTATVIEHYRDKGGTFRKPGDLRKIYGIRPELAERLIPFADISAREKPPPKFRYEEKGWGGQPDARSKPVKAASVVDISVADSLALVELSGIGPRLAVRIINFRQKLGGFYSVDQLAETYGLPDSTFQKLRPQLKASGDSVKKIALNSVGFEVLRAHPYVKWALARAIIAYRDEHGPLTNVNDLEKIALITPEWLKKMASYLEL